MATEGTPTVLPEVTKTVVMAADITGPLQKATVGLGDIVQVATDEDRY